MNLNELSGSEAQRRGTVPEVLQEAAMALEMGILRNNNLFIQ